MLSDDITSLIGFACEAVLYGMYCILFLASVWLTFAHSGPLKANKFIAGMNILLFLVCTTHFGITFNGFYTILGSTGVEGYGNGTPAAFGANILISVADWIGEMILIYRCWAIWGRNYYVVVLPFVASTAALACFCAAIHLVLGESPTAPQPPPSIAPLVLAAYILPLCANFILTALIAGRIWYMSRGAISSLQGGVSLAFRAAIIIVESGVLYFVVQVIYLTVFALHDTSDETMSLIAVQIYGIAPTLIVLQVGLGLTSEDTTKYTTGGTLSFVNTSKPTSTTIRAGASDCLSSGTRLPSAENSFMSTGSKMEFEENPDIVNRPKRGSASSEV